MAVPEHGLAPWCQSGKKGKDDNSRRAGLLCWNRELRAALLSRNRELARPVSDYRTTRTGCCDRSRRKSEVLLVPIAGCAFGRSDTKSVVWCQRRLCWAFGCGG